MASPQSDMISAPQHGELAPDDGRTRLAVFDLDGTITRRDTYVAYLWGWLRAHPLCWLGTPRLATAVVVHKLGWRDNTWLKQQFLHIILGGVDDKRIRAHTISFLDEWLDRNVRSAALEEIEQQRRLGSKLVLLTASLDIYADEIGQRLGFDTVIATKAAWTPRGQLSGQLASANCQRDEKVVRVEDYIKRPRDEYFVIAFGDDVKDVPILDWADVGVAVTPGLKLRDVAPEKGFSVEAW